jgi:hypothetical protein
LVIRSCCDGCSSNKRKVRPLSSPHVNYELKTSALFALTCGSSISLWVNSTANNVSELYPLLASHSFRWRTVHSSMHIHTMS